MDSLSFTPFSVEQPYNLQSAISCPTYPIVGVLLRQSISRHSTDSWQKSLRFSVRNWMELTPSLQIVLDKASCEKLWTVSCYILGKQLKCPGFKNACIDLLIT